MLLFTRGQKLTESKKQESKKQDHPRTAASLLDDLSLPALSPEELDLRKCTYEEGFDFYEREGLAF